MLFISDAQSYVPVKLVRSTHLFKLVGETNTWKCEIEKKLDFNYIGDRLERSQHDFE